jgi:hypothetical protein
MEAQIAVNEHVITVCDDAGWQQWYERGYHHTWEWQHPQEIQNKALIQMIRAVREIGPTMRQCVHRHYEVDKNYSKRETAIKLKDLVNELDLKYSPGKVLVIQYTGPCPKECAKRIPTGGKVDIFEGTSFPERIKCKMELLDEKIRDQYLNRFKLK